jgi:hypothetical protein
MPLKFKRHQEHGGADRSANLGICVQVCQAVAVLHISVAPQQLSLRQLAIVVDQLLTSSNITSCDHLEIAIATSVTCMETSFKDLHNP